MKYLGIDIGKEKHTASLISESGEQLFKPFLFTNSAKGYAKLTQKLNKFKKDTIIIGMEATGHYWLNLYEKLHADKYFITVLNPIQVKAFRNQGVVDCNSYCESFQLKISNLLFVASKTKSFAVLYPSILRG